MTAKAETVTPPEPAVPAPPQDRLVSTRHTLRLPKREVDYSATVGTMVLKLEREATGENAGSFEGEKPAAEMFFVAYTREDTTAPEKRPVTFVFNGGPGSSSVWLHMGMLGPRRVALDPDGHPLTPPGQLIDNPACILDRLQTWYSSTRCPPATAGRQWARKPGSSTRSNATSKPWAISSACMSRATSAGPRPNSWRANHTAPHARRGCPPTSRSGTASS